MRYAERRRACKQIIRITFIHNISVIISPFPFPNVDICTFFRGANRDVRKDQNVGAHIIWKLLKMSHFSWFQLSINSNCFKKCNENQMNLAKFSRNYFVWYKTPSSHFKRNVWHLFDWKVSSNVIHILENIRRKRKFCSKVLFSYSNNSQSVSRGNWQSRNENINQSRRLPVKR